MGGRFVSESGRPKTEWRPLGAVNCKFMARDDFTEVTKKILAERVSYKCSNPFCRRIIIGPQNGDKKTVNIGEVAHICAAAKGGKRYNSEMTAEERKWYMDV